MPPPPGQDSTSSTWYAAVSMPLAFTQEDFLVCRKIQWHHYKKIIWAGFMWKVFKPTRILTTTLLQLQLRGPGHMVLARLELFTSYLLIEGSSNYFVTVSKNDGNLDIMKLKNGLQNKFVNIEILWLQNSVSIEKWRYISETCIVDFQTAIAGSRRRRRLS